MRRIPHITLFTQRSIFEITAKKMSSLAPYFFHSLVPSIHL
jgi:hypothetical protein